MTSPRPSPEPSHTGPRPLPEPHLSCEPSLTSSRPSPEPSHTGPRPSPEPSLSGPRPLPEPHLSCEPSLTSSRPSPEPSHTGPRPSPEPSLSCEPSHTGPRPSPLGFLAAELEALAAEDRLRDRRRGPAPDLLDFASNDYLGYARLPWTALVPDGADSTRRGGVRHAGRLAPPIPIGAGASRLVTGTHAAHLSLERAVATHVGAEDALVFTSGYAANVGALSCLLGPDDLVVSDRLAHASIIDGLRLSRAKVVVVPHLDVAAAREALRAPARRRWLVTESLFSMDGTAPDLGALRAVCDAHGAALYVDEAHALGVLGPSGEGSCRAAGVTADVLVGTFGKALGGQGAFVAGSGALVRFLYNRARSFVFSTGISPVLAAHAEAALARARADEAGRERLRARTAELVEGLAARGWGVAAPSGPIVPLVLGSESRALRAMEALAERGLRVVAIRPPTVPAGTSRLRLTLSAAHGPDDVARLLMALGEPKDLRGPSMGPRGG